MYTVRWNHRMIFLRRMMEYYLHLMVIRHELGHNATHRNLAKKDGMKEFTFFKMMVQTEYETTAFAAHLLLDNREIFELAKEGMDVVQIAQMLNSDINLALSKCFEMNKLGYDFRITYEPNPCFFRKVKSFAGSNLIT